MANLKSRKTLKFEYFLELKTNKEEYELTLIGENINFLGDSEAEVRQKAMSWICNNHSAQDDKVLLFKRN